MFKKALWITDLHFGKSTNSKVANEDNIDFLVWAIDRAKSWGAETCIMGGDFFDNRFSVGIESIHYAAIGMKLLSEAFEHVFFVAGNHDSYFKENLSIVSTSFAEFLPNIKVIRKPTTIGDSTVIPWMVGKNKELLSSIKSRYVFSHLEFSGFRLNSNVIMPESDDIMTGEEFSGPEQIFVGHFHQRQIRKFKNTEVIYTGSATPHNFSDVNDEDRGLMLLEFGHDPIFEAWPEQPLYKSLSLSTLLNDGEAKHFKPKMSVKLHIDLPMETEEIQELREAFIKNNSLRKMQTLLTDQEDTEQEFSEEVEYKNVDQLFIEGLQSVESKGLDNNKLIKIFSSLKVKS